MSCNYCEQHKTDYDFKKEGSYILKIKPLPFGEDRTTFSLVIPTVLNAAKVYSYIDYISFCPFCGENLIDRFGED